MFDNYYLLFGLFYHFFNTSRVNSPIIYQVVQRDLGKAKHWLARAAAKGDKVAIRLLESIDEPSIDEREQAAERAAAELLRELDGA